MYMFGVLPFQGYGFLHVIIAQAVHLIHIWLKTEDIHGDWGYYVHSMRTFFAVNVEV